MENLKVDNIYSDYLKLNNDNKIALGKEENNEFPLSNLNSMNPMSNLNNNNLNMNKNLNIKEQNKNENEYLKMDHKHDYLMEYYPINKKNSLDLIKKIPNSLKSLGEDYSNANLPKVFKYFYIKL